MTARTTVAAMATPPETGFDISWVTDPEAWRVRAEAAAAYLREQLLTIDAAIQAGAAIAALAASWLIAHLLVRLAARVAAQAGVSRLMPRLLDFAKLVIPPLVTLIALYAAQNALATAERPIYLVRIAVSLAGAWLIIRCATRFIGDPFWARAAATVAWAGALLNIFGLLGPATRALDAVGFEINDTRLSLLIVLRAAVIATLLLAFAGWLSQVLSRRIQTLPRIEPSLRILFARTLQVALITTAGLIGLATLGLDLSAFALFSGALGLGVGFGLQKIVANFVSGVVLLLDRSLKPGDVIRIEDTYGWVNSLGLRYASIITRDGHEHLIPNEVLMTEKVENWSFSDSRVRIKRGIGVAYSSDVHLARKLVIDAATSIDRVIAFPAPVCQLNEFGDNSVNLELRFWIADPQNGINNVSSEVLLAVWDSFHANGVEFPFPQRDVHLKTGGPIRVKLENGD